MQYLARTLEPGDHYYNYFKPVTLPHDRLMDKPDELEALSGPVKKYIMKDGELVGSKN